MAVTPQSFLTAFGQFQDTPPARITPLIASASLVAGEAFGDARDQAIMLLVAHYLSLDPRNENMAQVKGGAPGTTIYKAQYDDLVKTFRPVGTTSGPPTPPTTGST